VNGLGLSFGYGTANISFHAPHVVITIIIAVNILV
jgi:hypothetical protein